MEDNLMKGMQEWMKNAQNDVENFKKLADDEHEGLDEKQKAELNEALKGVDMKSLTDVIESSSSNIMSHIQGMFK